MMKNNFLLGRELCKSSGRKMLSAARRYIFYPVHNTGLPVILQEERA